jgi:hypothetical protein
LHLRLGFAYLGVEVFPHERVRPIYS